MKSLSASVIGVLLAVVPASLWSDNVPAWIERLGWTLVHSVWQLAAVAIVALLVDRGLRRRSANARYIAGVFALGLMFALPCATWLCLPLNTPNELASRVTLAPG
ncbi:MAG: hypothetical protein IAG10_19820, partial [Planctomycetaceae bacterium]|nr:hypothetical protein [Planctomycetaceae bacterium]